MFSATSQALHLGYGLLILVGVVLLGLPLYRMVFGRLLLAAFAEDRAGGDAAVKRLARAYIVMVAILGIEAARATTGLAASGPLADWTDRLLGPAVAFFAIETFRAVAIDLVVVSRRKRAVPKILRDIGIGVLYVVVALIFLSRDYNLNLAPILTFSGLFSIVIGMALQDTLGNLFSGLAINMEPPFSIGDWVIIDDQTAQIREITWRATKALTRRHELVILPNSVVAKAKIVNLSRPSSAFAHDVLIGVSYHTPPAKIVQALESCIAQTEQILRSPAPSIKLVNFGESAQEFRLRVFLDGYENQSNIVDDLLSRIWYKFQQLGYEIAFPARTLYEKDHSHQNKLDVELKLDTFGRVDFLAALGDDERKELATCARIAKYQAGEIVFSQGDPGDSLYILSEGRIELLIGVEDEAHPIATLEEGSYFGEMALLTGEPRSATARTLTPCDVVVLTKRDLEHLFHDRPEVPMAISRVIGERQAQTTEKHRRIEEALESRVAKAHQGSAGSEEAALEIFNKIKSFFKLT